MLSARASRVTAAVACVAAAAVAATSHAAERLRPLVYDNAYAMYSVRPDGTRWQRLNEIFHAALALSREERSAFVSHACAGDESLRRESEELLRAHDGAERDLGPIERLEITLDEPDSPGLAGQRLGPYRITDEIGRGGMGAVWLADRGQRDLSSPARNQLSERR